MLDYILNVAVGISAGVAAMVSAIPALQPHTLRLCLAILLVLTLVNLRGIREAGLAFMLPTYVFVGSLGAVIVLGLLKPWNHGGIRCRSCRPQVRRRRSLWEAPLSTCNHCSYRP